MFFFTNACFIFITQSKDLLMHFDTEGIRDTWHNAVLDHIEYAHQQDIIAKSDQLPDTSSVNDVVKVNLKSKKTRNGSVFDVFRSPSSTDNSPFPYTSIRSELDAWSVFVDIESEGSIIATSTVRMSSKTVIRGVSSNVAPEKVQIIFTSKAWIFVILAEKMELKEKFHVMSGDIVEVNVVSNLLKI